MRIPEVVDGSIASLAVDAIVNAANATLAGGGGVDGAIHNAAGPELKSACLAFPELRPGVRCEVGEVKVTPGFKLPARYVIHTVGPIWHGGDQREPELLALCYRNALTEARRLGLSSVAFPAISTGAFGYPAHLAAEVSAREVVAFVRDVELRVVFACLGVAMVKRLERAVRAEL